MIDRAQRLLYYIAVAAERVVRLMARGHDALDVMRGVAPPPDEPVTVQAAPDPSRKTIVAELPCKTLDEVRSTAYLFRFTPTDGLPN